MHDESSEEPKGATALALRSVTKRYGELPALREVSLSVGYGEAVGYLGPNGAGKSTTLKLLAGLATPTSGTVEVGGHALGAAHPGPSPALGTLIEMPGVLPYMHGRDLLLHAAEVRRIPYVERPSRVRTAAQRLGVESLLDRPLGQLSTGQLRRLQLAATLVGDPKILLLDEPTLGLDPVARADLRTLLRSLRREGHTLFLTTHLVEDVEQVCDRVLFLKDGRLAGDEPVHPTDRSPGGARPLLVRTLRPLDLRELTTLLGPAVTVEIRGEREARLTLGPSEEAQGEALARLAGSRFGLLEAGVPVPDLAARYLTLVGREEAE